MPPKATKRPASSSRRPRRNLAAPARAAPERRPKPRSASPPSPRALARAANAAPRQSPPRRRPAQGDADGATRASCRRRSGDDDAVLGRFTCDGRSNPKRVELLRRVAQEVHGHVEPPMLV